MRTLTSIQSATDILVDIEFRVTASDLSTTWLFDRNTIQSYPSPEWEIGFNGGLGKTSNYDITIASSMGFLNENDLKLRRAETFLKVYVNSDQFTPHVGRVRGVQRNASNPNIFTMRVYEAFLDSDPFIPIDSVQDSYSGLHLEVLNADFGTPLYYGKQVRPFYFTPVACDLSLMLGPKNISSASYVTSLEHLYDKVDNVVMGLRGDWDQPTNTVSRFWGFELFEVDSSMLPLLDAIEDIRPCRTHSIVVTSQTQLTLVTCNYPFERAGFSENWLFFQPRSPIHRATTAHIKFYAYNTTWDIDYWRIQFHADHTHDTLSYTVEVNSIGMSVDTVFDITSMYTPVYDVSSVIVYYKNHDYFQQNRRTWIDIQVDAVGVTPGAPLVSLTMSYQLTFDFQLKSSVYQNYSVYGLQVNCSDIAVSENPNHILADIIDQTSFSYNAAQNSAAQVHTNSFIFQCFLGERKSLSSILDEFGETTATHYWIGDSGFLNARTYQESAVVTDSVDYTITTTDILRDSLEIKENPLGFVFYQTQKASRIRLDYDYDYGRGLYQQSMVVDRSNNAYCNSAYAAGIQKNQHIKSKHIIESQTASYYLDNMVRKYATDDVIIEGTLPARFMGMELTDILHVQHPALIGSESLFQVTKLRPNYENGEIRFTANEIVNITY